MRPDLPLRPSFSVSHSSARRLEECARAHYWARYGSWGGWDAQLPETDERRLAYILKSGKGLPGLVGDVVHLVAKTAIDGASIGLRVPDAELREVALTTFRAGVQNTVEQAWKADPKGHPPVLDVLYDTPGWQDRLSSYETDLEAAVDALLLNLHLRAVLEGRVEVLYVEDRYELQVPFEDGPATAGPDPIPGSFTVYVITDLVYRRSTSVRTHVIVDWKTGKVSEANRAQVGLYAAWLSAKDGVAPSDIAGVEVYLPHFLERSTEGSDALVTEALHDLRVAASWAKAYVVDGDMTVNQPIARELFPLLPEGARECRWCPFRRLCGRG